MRRRLPSPAMVVALVALLLSTTASRTPRATP